MKTIVLALIMLTVGPMAWAASYDLPTYGSTATVTGTALGGTAIVTEFDLAMQTTVSSGTGVIDPFLTVQANGYEQGFNTDASPLPLDAKRGGQPDGTDAYTHALLAGDLGTFVAGSTTSGPGGYFNFTLDVNEPKGNGQQDIILDGFRVWIVSSSIGGSLSTLADVMANGTEMFNLGDNTITINYDLWNGSGQNMDVLFQIPTFAVSPDDFVYVWTSFSNSGDGFEEWCAQTGSAPVPEPGTIVLLGFGLATAALIGARRMVR